MQYIQYYSLNRNVFTIKDKVGLLNGNWCGDIWWFGENNFKDWPTNIKASIAHYSQAWKLYLNSLCLPDIWHRMSIKKWSQVEEMSASWLESAKWGGRGVDMARDCATELHHISLYFWWHIMVESGKRGDIWWKTSGIAPPSSGHKSLYCWWHKFHLRV